MIDRCCISLNNYCNMNCKYCYFYKRDNIRIKDVQCFGINEIKVILDNIFEYCETKNLRKKFIIGIVGSGEPLLNFKEIEYIINYTKEVGKKSLVRFYVITNGYNLESKKLDFLFNNKDLIDVSFSLDGDKELHDLNRVKWIGKEYVGTFYEVFSNIKRYALKFGRMPSINVTVHKFTISKIKDLYDFLIRENFSKVTFSKIFDNKDSELYISDQEFSDFIEEINKINEHLIIRNIEARDSKKVDCSKYGAKCGVGITNIFYGNGKIYPCGRFLNNKEFQLGNYNDKLRDIESKFSDCKYTKFNDLRESFKSYHDVYISKSLKEYSKIVLYGLPRSGKNYAISKCFKGTDIKYYSGSSNLLSSSTLSTFRNLPNASKELKRRNFIKTFNNYRLENPSNYIVDGHFSFPKKDKLDICMLDDDLLCYDYFLYKYTKPEIIYKNFLKDKGSIDMSNMPMSKIESWQNFEITNLKVRCASIGKELIVIDDNKNIRRFSKFLVSKEKSINSNFQVDSWIEKNKDRIANHNNIIVIDGDKTISNIDKSKELLKKLIENKGSLDKEIGRIIFKNDIYTSYQIFQYIDYFYSNFSSLEIKSALNSMDIKEDEDGLMSILKLLSKKYLIIVATSGLKDLWDHLTKDIDRLIIGSTLNAKACIISSFSKKLLVEKLLNLDKNVIAIGDSEIDIPMLEAASKGFLIINSEKQKKRLATSLNVKGGLNFKVINRTEKNVLLSLGDEQNDG